jgi:transcriptional regulator with GAF, ATPase, and Fis domain
VTQPSQAEMSTQAKAFSRPALEDLVLIVLTGTLRGKRIPFGERLRVGKSGDNDLVLPDATVSRHHCELCRSDRGIVVRDLGSTNHTRVASARVSEAVLDPGVTLTVGDVDLVLRTEPFRGEVSPSESPRFGDAVGPSLAMRSVFGVLEKIAPTDAAVLIEGETGTGKDVLARAVHQRSARSAEPFVVVDCGAVSYNLLESELFGHERGAFTGAVSARAGAFETAGRGTLFLDEVGELPLDVQPKLLRVLESGEFRRVGGNRTQRSRARIVAATKRKLSDEVARGKFREDLFFRLSVVPVTVPALRSRREDIPALVEHFLAGVRARDPSLTGIRIGSETLGALASHDWPGNVRELRNVLDRAVYLAAAGGRELMLVDLPVSGAAPGIPGGGVIFEAGRSYRHTRAQFEADFELRYVTWLLERHEGNLSAAAREARMDRKYLYDLARKHGLRQSRS